MKAILASDELSAEWKSLISQVKELKILAPNEITRGKLMEETGMSRGEAEGYITKLIKLGKVEVSYKTIDGHKQKVIRLK